MRKEEQAKRTSGVPVGACEREGEKNSRGKEENIRRRSKVLFGQGNAIWSCSCLLVFLLHSLSQRLIKHQRPLFSPSPCEFAMCRRISI